jgi:adenylosuccinate synthase
MTADPRAILVIDLGFGDAGKGTIVDFLARRLNSRLVVRFNGGPQAGHNVVTDDGRHHTFAQFGAASFIPGTRTLLASPVLIEPYAIFNEAAHLESVGVRAPIGRLMIDRRCPVITPAHQAANRLREIARGSAAHGTCGMGVGETMADVIDRPDEVICAGELGDGQVVRRKLMRLIERKQAELCDAIAGRGDSPWARQAAETLLRPTWIDAAVENYAELSRHATLLDEAEVGATLRAETTPVLFEGAQGVLLDQSFGFHPHTTWSDTTFGGANAVLDECRFSGERHRIGVLRTYCTRHGAGPMVTEDASLAPLLPEPHNTAAGWQGMFRVGSFDAVMARYALSVVGGVDGLAITHLDRLSVLPPRICVGYGGPLGAVASIESPAANDLPARKRLAAMLSRSRPVWESIDAGSEPAWCRAVDERLQTRVTILSSGPAAGDKSFRFPSGI